MRTIEKHGTATPSARCRASHFLRDSPNCFETLSHSTRLLVGNRTVHECNLVTSSQSMRIPRLHNSTGVTHMIKRQVSLFAKHAVPARSSKNNDRCVIARVEHVSKGDLLGESSEKAMMFHWMSPCLPTGGVLKPPSLIVAK
jgi:hypothetical protein